VGDFRYASAPGDKGYGQGNEGVLHPKARDLVLFKNKEHAPAVSKFFAKHEALFPLGIAYRKLHNNGHGGAVMSYNAGFPAFKTDTAGVSRETGRAEEQGQEEARDKKKERVSLRIIFFRMIRMNRGIPGGDKFPTIP
jgi:hypothetical protein